MNDAVRVLRDEIKKRELEIQKLQGALNVLLNPSSDAPSDASPEYSRLGMKLVKRGMRRSQLEQFLREKGPTSGPDIMSQTGMPRGTLYGLFAKGGFVQGDDGRWTLEEGGKVT